MHNSAYSQFSLWPNNSASTTSKMVFETQTQTQSYQYPEIVKSSTKQMVYPNQNIPTTLNWIATKKSATKLFSEEEIIVPSPQDVICCKGNLAFHHDGNLRLQDIVRSHVDQYEAAQSKGEKSMVVSLVTTAIREERGRFVRKDPVSGTWKVATSRFAREKVGQMFRNVLHSQYKSSTTSKRRRREVLQANYDCCVMDVVRSSAFVKEEMTALSDRVHGVNNTNSNDEAVATMFLESNTRLLANFKESKAVAKLSSMISCLPESPYELSPVAVE